MFSSTFNTPCLVNSLSPSKSTNRLLSLQTSQLTLIVTSFKLTLALFFNLNLKVTSFLGSISLLIPILTSIISLKSTSTSKGTISSLSDLKNKLTLFLPKSTSPTGFKVTSKVSVSPALIKISLFANNSNLSESKETVYTLSTRPEFVI